MSTSETLAAIAVVGTNLLAVVVLIVIIRSRHYLRRLHDLVEADADGYTLLEKRIAILEDHERRITVLEAMNRAQK